MANTITRETPQYEGVFKSQIFSMSIDTYAAGGVALDATLQIDPHYVFLEPLTTGQEYVPRYVKSTGKVQLFMIDISGGYHEVEAGTLTTTTLDGIAYGHG
jgi:hypothetical protein